jgi:hypothetical protein
MELSTAVDINGLNVEHQKRIREIGLDRWMDEQCAPTASTKPSRYSLESRQARMRKRLKSRKRRFKGDLPSDFRSVAH